MYITDGHSLNLQLMSLAALGATFLFFLLMFLMPYVFFYFLPYGFMVNKSFTQMPKHIQLIGGISNTITFSIPIAISLAMYIKLTLSAKNQDHDMPGEEDQQPDITSSSLKVTPWRKNKVSPQKPPNVIIPTLNTVNETSSESSGIHIIETVSMRIQNNMSGIEPSTHPDQDLVDPEEAGRYPRRPSIEIEASLRSMKANLLMLLLFFLHCFLLLIPSDTWRMFAGIIFESSLKFLLPTVTTISNFGPVKELVVIYLQRMFRPRVPSS
jgi:hypothetical protein